MVLLISRIQILQLPELLLDDSVGLRGQVELLYFDKELVNFVQVVVGSEVTRLSASSRAKRLFLERSDLTIVIILYFLEYVANCISPLLLVQAVVRVRPLHQLLNPSHLLRQDLVQSRQPLVKAVNFEDLLSLLAVLVSNYESNQEQ